MESKAQPVVLNVVELLYKVLNRLDQVEKRIVDHLSDVWEDEDLDLHTDEEL